MYSEDNINLQQANDGAYLQAYDWEDHNYNSILQWFRENWFYSVYFALIYIVSIHTGQIYMRKREPLKLKNTLILWNIALAVFSVIGFIRFFPELFIVLTGENGFYNSVCSREQQTQVTAFWSLIGSVSKVVELFDTGFVVLRKQPLIFLHWYHHTTVMLFSWFSVGYLDPTIRWMLGMNYFIHGIMYSYYALKASGFKLPRSVSVLITSLQLIQMVVGVTINVYSAIVKLDGGSCARKDANIFWGFIMYFSYMILFGHFFYRAYVLKAKDRNKKRN